VYQFEINNMWGLPFIRVSAIKIVPTREGEEHDKIVEAVSYYTCSI
jgi:hypothetical protein